ncbi:MAG: hypothetical protein NVV74_11330 [Magnetospirillum sp.]|nr:hypothetical protein [Magnetospirillum sp.]
MVQAVVQGETSTQRPNQPQSEAQLEWDSRPWKTTASWAARMLCSGRVNSESGAARTMFRPISAMKLLRPEQIKVMSLAEWCSRCSGHQVRECSPRCTQ